MKGMVDEEEEDDIDSETGSMMRKISSPRSSNQVDNGSNVFVTDFFKRLFCFVGIGIRWQCEDGDDAFEVCSEI